ncbi:putative MraW methylase [Streptomyces sp. Tu6071]|nr:putative MraW methylase [Streptomyces sp. Tu6071]
MTPLGRPRGRCGRVLRCAVGCCALGRVVRVQCPARHPRRKAPRALVPRIGPALCSPGAPLARRDARPGPLPLGRGVTRRRLAAPAGRNGRGPGRTCPPRVVEKRPRDAGPRRARDRDSLRRGVRGPASRHFSPPCRPVNQRPCASRSP